MVLRHVGFEMSQRGPRHQHHYHSDIVNSRPGIAEYVHAFAGMMARDFDVGAALWQCRIVSDFL